MTQESSEAAELEECRQVVVETLSKVKAGEKLSHGNLDIIPLFVTNGHALPYLLLSDAIQAGVLEVTEVSEGGAVPYLKVVNKSDKPVLILAGDELIGAKQNRIVNVTMIVAAASSLVMPVSCVEQGRWAYRSRRFAPGRKASYGLRREMTRDVRRSVRASGQYESDQHKIWTHVASMHKCLGAASPTGAMSDSYDKVEGRLAEFRNCLTCPEKASGFAAFINGRLVALELFEHPDILRKVWSSHVESYAIDAIRTEREEKAESLGAEAVAECSQRIARSLEEPRKSVGQGYDVGVETEDLVGAALVNESRVVHLQAFLGAESESDW